ncbi:MAG: peptide chain release factor 2 [Actinomycetota bacterium]|nr:peptide chain release factor 2 [Actinomycetota bacterium]
MKDLSDAVKSLRGSLSGMQQALDLEGKRASLTQLEAKASDPSLWDDPDAARAVTTELAKVKEDVDQLEGLDRRLSDLEVLYELAREEDDDSVEAELDAAVAELEDALSALELRSLYSGEHDELDAVCEVHSGAGGTDAQDWAEMLLRMYLRWAERRGYKVELEESLAGTEAGITSATFIVRGRYAYGLLNGEKGVHRLVRISPFDSQSRRHTAFASFEAVPFLEDASAEVEIDEKDLRIDTYRSSGAGGQHVNVTDSAVRITHEPTGIVVSCQNQRSQHHNKEVAMKNRAAKLAARAREERRKELDAIAGEQREVTWGSQIRSYVLQPYQMVKDLRTGYEVGNVNAVLDGDLDGFMEAYLRWKPRNT